MFARQQIVLLTARQTQQDLVVLKEMMESGNVKAIIDRRYPWRRSLKLSGIREKDTPKERSSSPCEAHGLAVGTRRTRPGRLRRRRCTRQPTSRRGGYAKRALFRSVW
jgi:hypothetical protein